jgi:hypothetical protein
VPGELATSTTSLPPRKSLVMHVWRSTQLKPCLRSDLPHYEIDGPRGKGVIVRSGKDPRPNGLFV